MLRRLAIAAALAAGLLGAPACGLDRILDDRGGQTQCDEPHRRHKRHPHGDRGPASSEPTQPADETPRPAPPGTQSIHLALGTPKGGDPSDDWLMIKPQYALSYNKQRLGPNWVSWELNASYYGGTERHRGKFMPDDSLPAGWYRVTHEDYSRSDYDRGHMVRSEDRTRSRADNDATFLLTNILPQRHDLNAGPWLRLEDYCMQLAKNGHKEMFVTAGPIYGARPDTIGHGVAVPESFFKIVVVLDRGEGPTDVSDRTRVIAVIMPNTTGIIEEPWGKYRTSVSEIERRTGYHFLTNVPEATRRVLEARVDNGPTG
jgi:endonuclease G